MENGSETSPQSVESCHFCYGPVNSDDNHCAKCSYPLKGSDDEKAAFVLRKNADQINLPKFKNKSENALGTLYFLAGFFMLCAIIVFFQKEESADLLAILLPYLILTILFLILGSYAKQKPLACFISGLCLYIIIEVLVVAEAHFSTNFIDIIFNLIVIGFLVNGIRASLEIERIKKENDLD